MNLKAECISLDENNMVFVKNVSEEGVCIQTAPADAKEDFNPGIPVELRIEFPSGETVKLNCEIRWVSQNQPDGITTNVGLEIERPPAKYKKFVKNLILSP